MWKVCAGPVFQAWLPAREGLKGEPLRTVRHRPARKTLHPPQKPYRHRKIQNQTNYRKPPARHRHPGNCPSGKAACLADFGRQRHCPHESSQLFYLDYQEEEPPQALRIQAFFFEPGLSNRQKAQWKLPQQPRRLPPAKPGRRLFHCLARPFLHPGRRGNFLRKQGRSQGCPTQESNLAAWQCSKAEALGLAPVPGFAERGAALPG